MKLIRSLLLLLLFGWGAVFSQPLSEWIADDKTGCKVYNPSPVANETIKLTGSCVDGYATGLGTVQWFKNGVAGNIVTSTYVNGRGVGLTHVKYPNGQVFNGFLANGGKRDGQGILYFSNGTVDRQGRWENGSLVQTIVLDSQTFAFNKLTTVNTSQVIASYQSSLPRCPDTNPGSWSSCVGTVDFGGGLKYVGEFKNGKPYDKNNVTSKHKQENLTFIETINGDFLNTGYISLYTDFSRLQVNGVLREFPLLIEFLSPMRMDNNYSIGSLEAKFSINCNSKVLAALNAKVYFAPKWEGAAVEFFDSETVSLAKRFNQLSALVCRNDIQNRVLQAQADQQKRDSAERLATAQQQNQVAVTSPMTTLANRKALVIGNDTYKSITKLLNAREDAKAIASNLTAVGYKVTLQLDLNEKEMKAALRTFSSQVQGGDEVLFFFAGHGVQLGAANYLLPTDIGGESEAQVKDEAIQLQRVLDDMTEKKAKFTLAMIDACRDNPFKSTGRNIGGRGLVPTTAATGQMVVFSAGSGQQALDRLGDSDKNKNGLFTRTFLKEMQKSGVSIDRIVKNVRNEVAELAKTVGHDQVPAIYDQVLGDFFFKK